MYNLSLLEQDTNIWVKIIIILLGSYILNLIIRRVFDRVFKKANNPKTRTVLQVFQNGVSVVILSVAILMLLSTFNINIIPLLASASILGFAIGFGSQALIKDLISGIFLLTSEVFYEGDIIKIGEVQGKVERVGIRTITIRDLSGVVHTIPNGTINAVANLTKDWSRANIDISVSADHPIDKVLDIFREEVTAMKQSPTSGAWIIGEPSVEGISDIVGPKVTIKTLFKTNQAKKWDLEREFKYRIKRRFEQEDLKFA